jgi:hypothetical protein
MLVKADWKLSRRTDLKIPYLDQLAIIQADRYKNESFYDMKQLFTPKGPAA